MSRLKQAFLDLHSLIKDLKKPDDKPLFKYYNVWDNQIDDLILGNTYAYGFNACFIEIDLGEGMMMGGGMKYYPNCMIRLVIANQLLNTNDGFMERNLEIFDIKDIVQKELNSSGKVSWCSALMPIEDKLDYKHGSIYKYILSFKTCFMEKSGSVYDGKIEYGYLDKDQINLNLNVFNVWQSVKAYKADTHVVSYQNDLYLCKTDNQDVTFNVDNWYVVKEWFKKDWVVDDYAAVDNSIYKCTEDNNEYPFNPAHWTLIVQHG